ncbi:hypothetical protein CEP51_000551 [Fusarium floridanum]|uniref:Uncharacterized protein n=1 Tax=Fusarium floridanum TaxID=1325733 RepID=A0A428SM02_9HYPO|nr:hypothetical protein CEP51_000551 [Fusarium floridanum]
MLHSRWSINTRPLFNLNLNRLERDTIKVSISIEALKPNSDTKIIKLLQLLPRNITNRRNLCPPTLRSYRQQHTNIEYSPRLADRTNKTSGDSPSTAFSLVTWRINIDETLEGVRARFKEGFVDAVVEVVCEGTAGFG